MRDPERAIWRGSIVNVVGLAVLFLAISALVGVLAGWVIVMLPGTSVGDLGDATMIGGFVALTLVALSVYVFARQGFPRVIVTAHVVEVRTGTKLVHSFARSETTFHSMVNRSFINGTRGPGTRRMLVATPGDGRPSTFPANLLLRGERARKERRSNDATEAVLLPYFGRRQFSLLMADLRTAPTTVNLDETRMTTVTKPPSFTQLPGTDDPGRPLPQAARRLRGDAFGSKLVLGRRAILLRALVVFAALASVVALSIVVQASQWAPDVLKSIMLLPLFFATPAALFFVGRIAWLARRIPSAVRVDGQHIRLGRRRYEFVDIAEISLTPPSYPEHMRTLTVRARRGLRRSWMLGHDQPGGLATQAFPEYPSFAGAVVTAATASGTAVVWDLE